MRASSFVLAALVATGSFQYESLARACSPACELPLILPASAQLPGNLAYFQVTTETSGQLALHTREGEPVAASIRTIGGDRVYAPDASVPEGTELVLSYPLDCGYWEAAELNAFAFTAGPPAQVSLGAAALSVLAHGTDPDASGNAIAYAAVRYTSPNTNPATFPITRHMATLDGESFLGTVDSGEWEFTILASCDPNAYAGGVSMCGGGTGGPAPGLHELKIQTHVLGAETQPEPVTVQLDLRCPAAAEGENDEPFEGEGQDLLWEPRPTPGADGAAGEDEGTDTAAVQDVVVGSGPSADAGSGCALASRNAAGSLGWTALGLLLGGGLFRRRRP